MAPSPGRERVDGAALDLGDVQALVRSSLRSLPHARYALYHLPPGGDGRRLLAWLSDQVTSAADRDVAVATQLAISATGLRALDLPEMIMNGFADEFVGGMNAAGRSRFLGDTPGEWQWGRPDQDSSDLLVVTFAADALRLTGAAEDIDGMAGECGARLVHAMLSHDNPDVEPFGFRDGISQPYVPELATSSDDTSARPVALGEFVLGYPNGYGRLTRRPVLPGGLDPHQLLPRLQPGVDATAPQGGADLGRNGTYLVLRTLAQDVAAFDAYLAETAHRLHLDAEWLAAKLVGRWRSGAPLAVSPDHDHPELSTVNEFGYADDPTGLRCPVGAHIRRANPRNSLDPRPGSDASQAVTDLHRLLRRGRVFDDGQQQGLQFLALNANLGRQFEFVQHSWLNDPKFAGLDVDLDPLMSPRHPAAVFTIPGRPFRTRLCGMPQFVTTLGGGYFFLPGLRAIRYLAACA